MCAYVVNAHAEVHTILRLDRTVDLQIAPSLVITWFQFKIQTLHYYLFRDFMRLLPVCISKLYVCTYWSFMIIISCACACRCRCRSGICDSWVDATSTSTLVHVHMKYMHIANMLFTMVLKPKF